MEGQLCAQCGDYGYFMMEEYEVLSETATTAELEQFVGDQREYFVIANWK